MSVEGRERRLQALTHTFVRIGSRSRRSKRRLLEFLQGSAGSSPTSRLHDESVLVIEAGRKLASLDGA